MNLNFSIKYDCGHVVPVKESDKVYFFGGRREGKTNEKKLCEQCRKKQEDKNG